MFWGTVILIIGVVWLLNSLFGFRLPLFRILFALFMVYIGVSMLLGVRPSTHFKDDMRATDHQAIFSSSVFSYPPVVVPTLPKYSTIFGSSSLDLTTIEKPALATVEDVVIFGNSQIILKKDTPVRIETETIFGRTEVLQKNIDSFGKLSYTAPGLKPEAPALTLKTSVIFGQLTIIEK